MLANNTNIRVVKLNSVNMMFELNRQLSSETPDGTLEIPTIPTLEGISALCFGLTHNQSLVEFALESNDLVSSNLYSLAKAIVDHPRLEHLNVASNKISIKLEILEPILSLVRQNQSLQKIHLQGNPVRVDVVSQFDEATKLRHAVADDPESEAQGRVSAVSAVARESYVSVGDPPLPFADGRGMADQGGEIVLTLPAPIPETE